MPHHLRKMNQNINHAILMRSNPMFNLQLMREHFAVSLQLLIHLMLNPTPCFKHQLSQLPLKGESMQLVLPEFKLLKQPYLQPRKRSSDRLLTQSNADTELCNSSYAITKWVVMGVDSTLTHSSRPGNLSLENHAAKYLSTM